MWKRVPATVFGLLMLAVFLLHALNYLYFFVDDEAIPFVFARHLVEGKGLVYNSVEGRVEGYSDFLHVLLAALYLQVERLLALGPFTVFFIAKTVSFASGAATVAVIWRALQRQTTMRPPGLVAGMAFLVLAPPLAIWSCSSLEMASVTLLVGLITIAVLEGSPTSDRLIAFAACLLILLRIDGFVYAFALIAPACVLARADRRREMLIRIVVPAVILFAVYHAWRVWYFGDWLPAPLAAKVLYRLHPQSNVLVRESQAPYVVAFLRTYGFVPAIVGLGLVAAAVRNQRKAWPLLASASLLIAYPALVGDWMLGFRFFLPAVAGHRVADCVGRVVDRGAPRRGRSRQWRRVRGSR